MNRGYIVSSNIIKVTSKIILQYTKNEVKFACKSPIFATGTILKDKKYKFNILIPKKLFNDLHVDTFYGVNDNERICIKVCDVLDPELKICISICINEKKDNQCGMYSLDILICSNITICNPIIFLCGTIIRKKKMCHFINIDDNNIHAIKMFITHE